MTEYLNDQRLHTVSFYDIRGFVHHRFLQGQLSVYANWRVSSDAETGKGRSDIIDERKGWLWCRE